MAVSITVLKSAITEILKDADLSTVSTKKIRQQLETKFNTDLTNRKKEIDDLVMKMVNSNRDDDQEENGTDKSEDEEGSSGSEESDEGGDANYDPKPTKRGKSGNAGTKKKAKGGKKGSSSEEEEDEEKGSESADSDKEAKKKAAAGQSSKPAAGGAKKNSGYTREYKLSPALADVVGAKQMARHEVVKKMWAVIKERDLRDPKDKRFTVCDPQLEKVFGIKRFNTFAMMKYLKNHFSEL